MTYDQQGRRVLHGHPQSWDDVMGVKHVSHPSTWEAEAKALRAENERLRVALRDVIGMLDDPTGGEHVRDMRGATVIARAALQKQEGE